MNLTTAPLSWHWGIIFLVCAIGAASVERTSRWYPIFWWPLLTLGGICSFTFLKSCGAGPRDGPSGLVLLFRVFPVTVVSTLGIATGVVCLRKRPLAAAAKAIPMCGGIIVSAAALFLTILAETRSVSVRVLDGDGKPISGITVTATATDSMTYKTTRQEATDSAGIALFRLARFEMIEVSASARNHLSARATFGRTGFHGDQKAWKIHAGSSSLMFFDRAFDPTTVDIYLSEIDELVLPVVRQRLAESLSGTNQSGDAKYALASIGANFENFEIMDQIPKDSALRGSYGTFLSKQAELLNECFKAQDRELPKNERRFRHLDDDALKPSGWNGLARWAGLRGKPVPTTAENLRIVDAFLVQKANKLLDLARPDLGAEQSTAGAYSELRFIAKHRLLDLTCAYRTATPRAKGMIEDAFEDLGAGYSDLEPLIQASLPLDALHLLKNVGKFRNEEELERARSYFDKLGVGRDEVRIFFEEQEKRLDNAPQSN